MEIDDNGEEVGSKKEKKDTTPDPKYWIVMLYANWSVACLNFEAVLAKLSVQYDVPHLKFGKHYRKIAWKKRKLIILFRPSGR